MSKAILYLIVGLPRSGKSTWIRNNKDRLNATVIENDWIRANILHANNCKSTEPALWMITDATMRILLSQGKNVILDGVNLTRFTRKFFIDAARECNAEVVCVWVDTSAEECKRRNISDYKLPEEIINKMRCSLDEPTLDEFDSITRISEADTTTC